MPTKVGRHTTNPPYVPTKQTARQPATLTHAITLLVQRLFKPLLFPKEKYCRLQTIRWHLSFRSLSNGCRNYCKENRRLHTPIIRHLLLAAKAEAPTWRTWERGSTHKPPVCLLRCNFSSESVFLPFLSNAWAMPSVVVSYTYSYNECTQCRLHGNCSVASVASSASRRIAAASYRRRKYQIHFRFKHKSFLFIFHRLLLLPCSKTYRNCCSESHPKQHRIPL